MKVSMVDTAMTLSDQDLLARIAGLAARERETSVELVAHLAVLELRPNLYLAQGYGSLFRYCTGALGLSEDAACNRTKVTRACRDYPAILDLLAAGTVSLTTVKMLAPHLTAANHEAVLARATNRSREEIEALVAELAPQPDVVASVRKLPVRKDEASFSEPPALPFGPVANDGMKPIPPSSPDLAAAGRAVARSAEETTPPRSLADTPHAGSAPPPAARPIVRASAPDRYRVQFTIDQETYDELRKVQALLRREIPSGDAGVIFGRALHLLRQKVERAKFAATVSRPAAHPVQPSQGATYEMRIRPRTDDATGDGAREMTRGHDETPGLELPAEVATVGDGEAVPRPGGNGERRLSSRHIPNAVKRVVWWRDSGQCAFLSADGRRCAELSFLELHHLRPYALDGPATADNIALRCRRHNQYESELIFGPYDATRVREGNGRYGTARRPDQGRAFGDGNRSMAAPGAAELSAGGANESRLAS
jgi:hypothetical protein